MDKELVVFATGIKKKTSRKGSRNKYGHKIVIVVAIILLSYIYPANIMYGLL